MTWAIFVAGCAAGGVGAVARLVIDGAVRSRVGSGFPLGTMIINLSGSLLLGLVSGVAIGGWLPQQWRFVLGTGLLGGYTTFSTASLETVRLVEARRRIAALINGLGMLVLGASLAGLGLWMGLSLTSS